MDGLQSIVGYSFALSVLHALHAVYDVDVGRQVVPLHGQHPEPFRIFLRWWRLRG